MKNAAAIFFILCANIVLLTHAVVPHHHHDDVACFELMIVNEPANEQCCDHEDAGHQKKHDAGTSNDCCVLNDFMAIIPDSYKQDLLAIDFSCNERISNHFLSIIVPGGSDLPLLSYRIYFRLAPFPENYVSANGSLGPGLRAPPSC